MAKLVSALGIRQLLCRRMSRYLVGDKVPFRLFPVRRRACVGLLIESGLLAVSRLLIIRLRHS